MKGPMTCSRRGPVRGAIEVPGDKSISHRSLLFGALAVGETGAEVATVRSSGLVLTGSSSGHVGRPVASTSMAAEFEVPGSRSFYLADACTSVECVANWPGLAFPYPEGPAVGLVPAFLDVAGVPTTTPPSRGAGISFTTASGRSPSGRHPTSSGSAVSSALPNGMALFDKGLAGTGVRVYTSYVSGFVMSFSTSSTPSTMKLIR